MEDPIVKRSIIIWITIGVLLFVGLFLYTASRDSEYWNPNAPEKVMTLNDFKEDFSTVKEALHEIHRLHDILVSLSEIIITNSTLQSLVQNSFFHTEKSIASLKYAFRNDLK